MSSIKEVESSWRNVPKREITRKQSSTEKPIKKEPTLSTVFKDMKALVVDIELLKKESYSCSRVSLLKARLDNLTKIFNKISNTIEIKYAEENIGDRLAELGKEGRVKDVRLEKLSRDATSLLEAVEYELIFPK